MSSTPLDAEPIFACHWKAIVIIVGKENLFGRRICCCDRHKGLRAMFLCRKLHPQLNDRHIRLFLLLDILHEIWLPRIFVVFELIELVGLDAFGAVKSTAIYDKTSPTTVPHPSTCNAKLVIPQINVLRDIRSCWMLKRFNVSLPILVCKY